MIKDMFAVPKCVSKSAFDSRTEVEEKQTAFLLLLYRMRWSCARYSDTNVMIVVCIVLAEK